MPTNSENDLGSIFKAQLIYIPKFDNSSNIKNVFIIGLQWCISFKNLGLIHLKIWKVKNGAYFWKMRPWVNVHLQKRAWKECCYQNCEKGKIWYFHECITQKPICHICFKSLMYINKIIKCYLLFNIILQQTKVFYMHIMK